MVEEDTYGETASKIPMNPQTSQRKYIQGKEIVKESSIPSRANASFTELNKGRILKAMYGHLDEQLPP